MGRIRRDRLAEQLREEISLLFPTLNDPRIKLATVSGVDLSEDFRHARIRVSVVGTPEEKERTLGGLKRATGHLRTELGNHLRLRYLPELVFELDETMDHQIRLDRLLRGAPEEKS